MITRFATLSSRLAAMLIALFTLAACGGGGGGGFNPDSNNNIRLQITGLNPAGEEAQRFSAGAPLTILVNLRGVGGSQGKLISLTSTVGKINPENGSSLTNEDGVASFTLSYLNEDGGGQVTASYTDPEEGTVTQTFDVFSDNLGPPYEISVKTTDNEGIETNRFSAASPLRVEVALYRINGTELEPVINEPVSIAATIGAVTPSNGSSLTNDSGIANFQLDFDGTAGAGTLTASYAINEGNIQASRNIESVIADLGLSVFIETSDAAGDTTSQFGPNAPLTVDVSLQSTSGEVAGKKINLESTVGTVTPSGSLLTDDRGQASFGLEFDGNFGAGTLTAIVAEEDGSAEASQNVESVDPGSDLGLRLKLLSPQGTETVYLSENSPIRIIVSITDDNGVVQDIDGETVFMESTIGTLSTDSSLTSNGQAEFVLSFDGTAGAGVVTATYGVPEGNLKQSANVESVADNAFTVRVSSGSGSVLETNEVFTVTAVLINSANNSGEAGAIITLSSDVATVTEPANGQALTNSGGAATFSLTASGSTGAGTIKAESTINGVTFSNELNVEVQAPPPPPPP
jgi:hypothetical protein